MFAPDQIVKSEQSFRMPISPSKRAYFAENTAPESPSKVQARSKLSNMLSDIRSRDFVSDKHNEETS